MRKRLKTGQIIYFKYMYISRTSKSYQDKRENGQSRSPISTGSPTQRDLRVWLSDI